MRNVYVSVTFPTVVRDLLRLGTLDLLKAAGDVRIILATPAHQVPEFRAEFGGDGVVIAPFFGGASRNGSHLVRRTLAYLKTQHNRSRRLAQWYGWLDTRLDGRAGAYREMFDRYPPALIVVTNVGDERNRQLIAEAHAHGVTTLGLIRSWDNTWKRLPERTQMLGVWSPLNKQLAVQNEHYRPEEVFVLGSPQFDPYFHPETLQPREQFLASVGIDPDCRVIIYATGGYSAPALSLDQSYLADLLLEARRRHAFTRPVHLVCRLHPGDRLEYFWRFRDEPNVSLSMFDDYVKTLGPTMTAAGVRTVANLLKHADAVITPASTMTLEAAIFGVPVIVPTFSTVQPEEFGKFLREIHFRRHFKEIYEQKLVPFADTPDELVQAINDVLQGDDAYRVQRQQLVERFVHFTDGRSGNRLADVIRRLAQEGRSGSGV